MDEYSSQHDRDPKNTRRKKHTKGFLGSWRLELKMIRVALFEMSINLYFFLFLFAEFISFLN